MNARLEAAAKALYEADWQSGQITWDQAPLIAKQRMFVLARAVLAAADAHDTTESRIADAGGGSTVAGTNDLDGLARVVEFWDNQYPGRAPHRIEVRRLGPWVSVTEGNLE